MSDDSAHIAGQSLHIVTVGGPGVAPIPRKVGGDDGEAIRQSLHHPRH